MLALLELPVHLLTAENYGYFRDELYCIAASERLDLGYVDFPPFVDLVTALARRATRCSRCAYALLLPVMHTDIDRSHAQAGGSGRV